MTKQAEPTPARPARADAEPRRADPADHADQADAPAAWADQRPAALAQRRLIHGIDHSPRSAGQAARRLAIQDSRAGGAQRRQLQAMFGPADGAARPVQRRIERGSRTGWGAWSWVAGGQALWARIEQGFNTELFTLRATLQAYQRPPAEVTQALATIDALIDTWDGRQALYFEANPAQGQPISAAELADQVDAALRQGRAAALLPEAPAPRTEPPEPQATAADAASAQDAVPDAALPEAQVLPETAEPLAVADTAGLADAETGPAETVAPTKAKKAKAPKAKKPSQAELQAQARQVNAEKRKLQQAKKAAFKTFGETLKKHTDALLKSEKISGMQTYGLDEQLGKLIANHQGGEIPQAMKKVYTLWTATLTTLRQANEAERRGSQAQWQTWTGLDDYRIIENLTGAWFTPATAPIQGPPTPDGQRPAQPVAEPIPIHVTYDLKSLRAPTGPINGLTAPQLLDDLLSVSNVAHRIHGTLESSDGDKPHVYWGGSDLGLGNGRYGQWSAMPPGWVAGPEGPAARPKVAQVLNDYVNATVLPRVELSLRTQAYTVYAWPAVEAVLPAT